MKITVTRALAKLKVLNDKITRSIANDVFVATQKGRGDKAVSAGRNASVVSAEIAANYNSVVSLMNERSNIKAAILKSNAVTEVTVLGKTMTVMEAIELKNSLASKSLFLANLKVGLAACNQMVARENADLEAKIERLLTQVYGSDKTKIEADVVKAVAEPQRLQSEAALLDPIDIAGKIKVLEQEVEALSTEIDFTLSEANAKTEIEV